MRTMRMSKPVANGYMFVDPEDFRSTLTVRQTVSEKKSSNKVSLFNSRSELSTNRMPLVIIEGCSDACNIDRENVVIKTSLSGSVENKAAVLAALEDHLYNLSIVRNDLINGLLPGPTTEFVVGYEVDPE